MDECTEKKHEVLQRLKRIEGQVKGIQKMVEDEKSCVDILVQVAAVRAAIHKVGGLVLENHSRKCITQSMSNENGQEALHELLDLVIKFMK